MTFWCDGVFGECSGVLGVVLGVWDELKNFEGVVECYEMF